MKNEINALQDKVLSFINFQTEKGFGYTNIKVIRRTFGLDLSQMELVSFVIKNLIKAGKVEKIPGTNDYRIPRPKQEKQETPKQEPKHNCFDVLGVKETADVAEIKSAFRKLVLIHHPDHGGTCEQFNTTLSAYRMALELKKAA